MTAHQGFDSARSLTSLVDQIPDSVDFAARYYSRNTAKNLSPAEAKALCEGDLKIVTVWEGQSSAPLMGGAQGQKDAAAASVEATQCGQPLGSVIYFAVDFDVTLRELRDRVLGYFAAVNAQLAGRYRVGAYGSGLTLATLKRSNLITFSWLGAAKGWSGSRGFTGWNIRQGLPADPYEFGFEIDPDESMDDDYGGWILP